MCVCAHQLTHTLPCQRAGWVGSTSNLEHGCDSVSGLVGEDDWDDFKLDEVLPFQHPFLQQFCIITFHQLEAAVKVCFNPTVNILQAFRKHASTFSGSRVYGACVSVLEPFNDHEEHIASRPFWLWLTNLPFLSFRSGPLQPKSFWDASRVMDFLERLPVDV